VLPQQGSAVAAVPTLVADDGTPAATGADARKEDGEDLRNLMIDPVGRPLPEATAAVLAEPVSAAPAETPPLAMAGTALLGLRGRKRRRRRGSPGLRQRSG
jgi:hypothetical protein